jgi:hypothetical protein
VLTTPYTATDQEKAAYDAAVIADMQTLANAEGKTDYELLNVFIEYAQKTNIHEVSAFPLSMRQMLLTDGNNLIQYGAAQGMDANNLTSWYGFGFDTTAPYPDVS